MLLLLAEEPCTSTTLPLGAPAAYSRIKPVGELPAISGRAIADVWKVGKVDVLEWIIDTRHRPELAWSAQGNRQPNDRRKNRHRDENADEKMLHTGWPNENKMQI
jgi:hypothetical protein